ncbi:unnamed protein product [Camellia sinensis]
MMVAKQSNNFDPRAAAANFPSGVQAYLAGLTFALAVSPCSTAVLATLLGYVAASKISGGWRHTMALTSDGKLYGWGWNKLAVLGGSLLGTFLSEKEEPEGSRVCMSQLFFYCFILVLVFFRRESQFVF